MKEESIITPEQKAFVGHETEFTDWNVVEKGMIQRFAMALGDSNPLYYDEEFAKKTKSGGIIAPPTFLFEWNHHTAFEFRGDDLYVKGVPLPSVRMRGGNEYEIFQPLRPGDVITTKSKIVDIFEVKGRSGKMVFVVAESTYTNQNGELLGKNRETIIFYPQLKTSEGGTSD